MHVHQLGGKIQVTFEVRRVNDVDDDIGGIVNQLFADIQLFRRISRQRLGTGQVDQPQTIALEIGKPLFSIYRHTAVVAHSLVST